MFKCIFPHYWLSEINHNDISKDTEKNFNRLIMKILTIIGIEGNFITFSKKRKENEYLYKSILHGENIEIFYLNLGTR